MMRLLKPCLGPFPCELWLSCCFACLSSLPITPQLAACMQAQSPSRHSWRLQIDPCESSSLMAIPHKCRLYKHVGPDGISYALVVAQDMFSLQEILEKIVSHFYYVNSMLPYVNADDPVGFFRQCNVNAGLKLHFYKQKIEH